VWRPPPVGEGIDHAASRTDRFDLVETVTVYVHALDGTLLDVIEDVDPGDPIEAHRHGRTSLKEAALWGAIATARYRELRAAGALERTERSGTTDERWSAAEP
jgi:hypothetical protein